MNTTPCDQALLKELADPVSDYLDDLMLFGIIDNETRQRGKATFAAELDRAGSNEQRAEIACRWMNDLETYHAFKNAYQ